MQPAIYETNLPGLTLLKRGKVRDIYTFADALLIVATDRISAFDVVMRDPVPGKGKILTQISIYWYRAMSSLVRNHLITADVRAFPDACIPHRGILKDRSMLVQKAEPLPIECVVRGYITGSGWKSYLKDGTVCGIRLPDGLKESDRLPSPIFTPSTKAEVGHDENISFSDAANMIGQSLAEKVRDLSLAIYDKGVAIAEEKGIIIADTKFEFGLINGDLVLIDEVMTPDSSRFWPKSAYVPGKAQPSFDKQYLRDYLSSIQWDKTPPAPHLPQTVIDNTRIKYEEAFSLLTGSTDD